MWYDTVDGCHVFDNKTCFDVMWYDTMRCYVFGLISCYVFDVMSCKVMRCNGMLCYVRWCDVMCLLWCNIVIWCVWCDVILWRMSDDVIIWRMWCDLYEGCLFWCDTMKCNVFALAVKMNVDRVIIDEITSLSIILIIICIYNVISNE